MTRQDRAWMSALLGPYQLLMRLFHIRIALFPNDTKAFTFSGALMCQIFLAKVHLAPSSLRWSYALLTVKTIYLFQFQIMTSLCPLVGPVWLSSNAMSFLYCPLWVVLTLEVILVSKSVKMHQWLCENALTHAISVLVLKWTGWGNN